MNWLMGKLEDVSDVFKVLPNLKWFLLLIFIVAFAVLLLWFPVLIYIANIQFIESKPFYDLIALNFEFLRHGVYVVPLLIIIWGIYQAREAYKKKLKRVYGR
ncbi:hypothetical protein [Acinetobacter guerrae]|uniref:hypothetical protein n=1 Tax=Acinetobacter guerrae TaxID=1843371 RepID=UPI00128E42BF|nr:hypothetical protein [Acinetobacter guerrae]MPW44750.1 hypothetical protein [Acinetobacter guerrae]